MHDFAVQAPNCVNDVDCGSPGLAITLFVVFYIVCTYIFVNLFTVVSKYLVCFLPNRILFSNYIYICSVLFLYNLHDT